VVETEINGGAMYAARFARDQGRPIYALDLPASGNRELLSSGATALNLDLSNMERLLEDLCHA
jgi:predicted Rossmann fold nucleotide-binding protein DprA/Smf involved in DNA uptake